jgi:hypothetical protein
MVAALAVRERKAEVWHQCLGQLSYSHMARMIQNEVVEGMDVGEKELESKMSEESDVYVETKQVAVSYPELRR